MSREAGKEELSTKEIKNLIDQCAELKAESIYFFGGEPLIHRDIFILIGHAHAKGFLTNADTNGLVLNEEFVRRLKEAGLDMIGVSLDSWKPEEHDRLRGVNGLFAKAIAGIGYCLDQGIGCYVSTYATKTNLANGDLRKMIKLSKELGVHSLRICPPYSTGRWIDRTDVILNEAERSRLKQLADDPIIHLEDVDGCVGFQKKMLYVSAYGDVQPCCYVPVKIGNIRDIPLKEIVEKGFARPMYEKYGNLGHCPMNDPAFRSEFIEVPQD
jgi:MoaA/NifB/PqqE/SkfB family radical SAM enzyme